ncbi:MAG: DUF4058 family protein [Planctomycetes bacterium]|nr:DUF4058 family protein [Planctomycetota bacterium]
MVNSPFFPCMDPYIETSRMWRDFHTRMVTALAEALTPQVAPRYAVMIEESAYLLWEEVPLRVLMPDAALVGARGEAAGTGVTSAVATLSPAVCTQVMPVDETDRWLEIRTPDGREVVTVIEMLSPTNKATAGDGHSAYLLRRNRLLGSGSNLVEIDLLRGGHRAPLSEPYPPGDYAVVVDRVPMRPKCHVFMWGVREPLPVVPIPLREGETEVGLDLRRTFGLVYDRARYDLSLRYEGEPVPPFPPEHRAWVDERRARRPA